MALRGAISMLMEVRGVGLGRTSYKRRVYTVYKLAESFARTTLNMKAKYEKQWTNPLIIMVMLL